MSRRLATLTAELAAVRGEPSDGGWDTSTHTRVRDRADDPPVPVVLPVPGVELVEVDELPDSERGAGGLGSSGS